MEFLTNSQLISLLEKAYVHTDTKKLLKYKSSFKIPAISHFEDAIKYGKSKLIDQNLYEEAASILSNYFEETIKYTFYDAKSITIYTDDKIKIKFQKNSVYYLSLTNKDMSDFLKIVLMILPFKGYDETFINLNTILSYRQALVDLN